MSDFIRHIIHICLLLLFWHTIAAQSYSFRRYGVEDGLPSSYLYNIAQDKDGFIWLASEGGICKFDGISFQSNPIPELGSEEAINMLFDSKNRLWMSLINSDIVCFDNGKSYRFLPSDLQKGEDIPLNIKIVGIYEDPSGHIWILSKYKEAIRIDSISNGVILKKKVFDFPTNSARVMASFGNANYFLGEYGAWKVVGDSSIFIKHPFEYSISPNYSFQKNDKIYYSSRENIHSFNFKTQEFKREFLELSPYTNKGINTLYADSKGDIWICTKDGLLYLQYSDDGTYQYQHLLKNHFLGVVFQDRDENFWITTQKKGLFFIPSTQIKVVNRQDGLSSERITSIIEDKNGHIVIGCDDNSYNFLSIEEGKPPDVIFKDKLTDINLEIYDIFNHQNGYIYFFSSGGLFKRNPSPQKSSHEKLNKFSFKTGQQAPDGSIWAGASNSALIVEQTGLRQVLKERTYAVAPLNKDEVWIGTVKGLYHYTSSRGAVKSNIPSLNTDIRHLALSKNNELWVGCKSEGLFILKDGKILKRLTTEQGLPSNSCRHILLEEDFAWVGTNNGIARISYDDYSIDIINTNDGLPSREINDIIEKEGLIIAATNRGLAYFPKNIITHSPIPSIHFNTIKINEQDTMIHPTYYLPYDENNIKVSFIALSYQSSNDMTYNIKMEGLDENWISSKIGKAEYPSLAPGDYVLSIKAKTLDSEWSEIQQLRFIISKPFWSRAWFIILSILGIASILGLITYNINKNTRKKNEIEDKLKEFRLTALRSQMNPHFMFNSLNSIQEFILLQDKKSANKYLSRFSKLMRSILDMSDKARIPLEKEIEALELYLELENMRFDGKLDYKIETNEDLNIEGLTLPSMLIQPYVENAIKHGLMHKVEDKKLRIRFGKEGNYLFCTVDDNGIGRQKSGQLKTEKKRQHIPKAMLLNEERLKLMNSVHKDGLNLEIIDKTDKEGNPNGTKIIIYIQQKTTRKSHNKPHSE